MCTTKYGLSVYQTGTLDIPNVDFVYTKRGPCVCQTGSLRIQKGNLALTKKNMLFDSQRVNY